VKITNVIIIATPVTVNTRGLNMNTVMMATVGATADAGMIIV